MTGQRPSVTPRTAKKPIAWIVSSLFALAPFALVDLASAQSLDGLRSHVRMTEWAAKAQEDKQAAQAHADEKQRVAETDTAAGQAKLAAQAKRDEEARLQQAAQAAKEDMIKAAQAREAQRLNEEARLAEAQRRAAAEAQAEQQRVAREQAAARARAEQAQREAEDARRKALAEAEENRRLAEQARREAEEARKQAQAHAETMRRQAEAQAAAARQRDEAAKVTAEAEAAHRAEAAKQQRLAAQQAEEAQRLAAQAQQAEAARRAEAERIAAAQAKAKAEQAAEAEQAQRRHAEAQAAQATREAEAAREAESARTAGAARAQALAEAARENKTATAAAQTEAADQSKPSKQAQAAAKPHNTEQQNNAILDAARRESSQPVSGGAAAGQFAQWLETESDAYGKGPSLSADQLRRVFLDAVVRAADRSPEVRQAQANQLAANADVDEAKGQRWPQVDIGSQSPSASFGGSSRTGSNFSNPLTVNVTTNVFDWGRTKNTIGSRERLSDAAKQAYQTAMENSGFEVSSTLVELGKQRNIVELSQQYVDRMATLVKMLSEIVQVDRGRGSELTQAKTRLLQAEAQRDVAESKVRDAKLNLSKLIGDGDVMIPRTRQWSVEPGDLPELLSLASAHPTLQQVRAEAEAADLNAQAVKASGRPQLNWVVSGGLNKDALGQRQGWQTMLSLNWGAFRGGSANAATEAASARASASWQRMEQQQRDLEYAIRTADQDARTMLQRADLYQGLSAETDKVRKAFFEQWYHLGRRTLLDVLTAESEHYGNRVAEVTNRFDAYLAVFREHHAAGGLVQWLQGPEAEQKS